MTLTVADLTRVADIWKLIASDRTTSDIHLLPSGAYVSGAYVEAIRVGIKTELKQAVTVDGHILTGSLGLFRPDAKLELRTTDASLIMKAGKRRAVLRMREAEIPPSPPKLKSGAELQSIDDLRDAVKFLNDCITEPAIDPVLTGILFRRTKTGFALAATDRTRMGRATIPSAVRTKDDHVVPAADLTQALALVGEEARVSFTKSDRIVIADKETAISLVLLQGEFPDVTKLPTKYPHSIELDVERVGTAIAAAQLIDDDRLLSLQVKDGRLAWVVSGQETGGFRLPVGRQDAGDVEIVFDADQLAAVLSIGDDLTLNYTDDRTPVLLKGTETKYRLWVAPIYRP